MQSSLCPILVRLLPSTLALAAASLESWFCGATMNTFYSLAMVWWRREACGIVEFLRFRFTTLLILWRVQIGPWKLSITANHFFDYEQWKTEQPTPQRSFVLSLATCESSAVVGDSLNPVSNSIGWHMRSIYCVWRLPIFLPDSNRNYFAYDWKLTPISLKRVEKLISLASLWRRTCSKTRKKIFVDRDADHEMHEKKPCS